LSDLMIHDFESGKATPVSDGMADVASPAFSRDGKYLFMAASTNAGPLQFGLDMSTQERPYRAGIYALVLAADGDSPLAPRRGDEEPGDENGEDKDKSKKDKKGEEEPEVEVRIDFDGLAERMVALPVAKGNYRNLQVAGDGSLFWMRYPQPGSSVQMPGENTI